MRIQEAISLIRNAVPQNGAPQTWADLGAGSGLFSEALISILPEGSIVHAVDLAVQNNRKHPSSIIFHRADFEKDNLKLNQLDGILMANSLHYVRDQLACIQKLSAYLRPGTGRFVIIEYDSDRANRWVPFPISFVRAKALFADAGFIRIEKIAEHPSVYQNNPIYCAAVF